MKKTKQLITMAIITGMPVPDKAAGTICVITKNVIIAVNKGATINCPITDAI